MGRGKRYLLVFGLALAALVALGAWWTVFLGRSIELERRAAVDELRHEVEVAAIRLGAGPERPALGPVDGFVGLEVVEVPGGTGGSDLARRLEPGHGDLAVRPLPRRLAEADRRLGRRRLMVAGEGSLLFVLLGVVTAMLVRQVYLERAHLRRMEEVVSAVTHEMKTPIAGIKSLLQTLAAGRVPSSELPRLVALGLKESERLEHGIENVLIAGRLRARRFEVAREALALGPLLEAFVARRRPLVAGGPEALRLEVEVEGLVALGDPDAVRVVLDNLADNALKYGAGSAVTIRAREEDGWARVSVEDRGVGFDPGLAEALFEPFRRGVPERSEAVQPGTGLGLSIARSLARAMGGELAGASPGPGQGAVFTLSLPAPEPARRPS